MRTYMITGSAPREQLVEQIVRAIDAGIDRIQLRRRRAPANELEWLVDAIESRRREARRRLLINDRLDVALATRVLGLHLPGDGFSARDVRRFAPDDLEIGVSVHHVRDAERAADMGADYVVYGPVFPTTSKPGHPGVGVESLIRVIAAVSIPVYALGGISAENLHRVAASGAAGVAGISVFESERSLAELVACLPS